VVRDQAVEIAMVDRGRPPFDQVPDLNFVVDAALPSRHGAVESPA
jgi:hypothetical protein